MRGALYYYFFGSGAAAQHGIYVKVSSAWKRADAVYVKVSGAWKLVQPTDISLKVGGAWKGLTTT